MFPLARATHFGTGFLSHSQMEVPFIFGTPLLVRHICRCLPHAGNAAGGKIRGDESSDVANSPRPQIFHGRRLVLIYLKTRCLLLLLAFLVGVVSKATIRKSNSASKPFRCLCSTLPGPARSAVYRLSQNMPGQCSTGNYDVPLEYMPVLYAPENRSNTNNNIHRLMPLTWRGIHPVPF